MVKPIIPHFYFLPSPQLARADLPLLPFRPLLSQLSFRPQFIRAHGSAYQRTPVREVVPGVFLRLPAITSRVMMPDVTVWCHLSEPSLGRYLFASLTYYPGT